MTESVDRKLFSMFMFIGKFFLSLLQMLCYAVIGVVFLIVMSVWALFHKVDNWLFSLIYGHKKEEE